MGIGRRRERNVIGAAQRAEDERQAQTLAAQQQINAMFDAPQRSTDIAQAIAAARQMALHDLGLRKGRAARQNRFGLARSGLIGGSVDVDMSRRVADDFMRGVLDAERGAQRIGGNLRQADEEARGNLLAMARSGLDATTLAQHGGNLLRGNLANARSNQTVADFSSLFGGVADILDASNQMRMRRQGLNEINNLFRRGVF